MANFEKTWTRQDKPGMSEKLRDSVKQPDPLKPRIQTAVNQLQSQITRLDTMLNKLRDRDARLFQRIVVAMKNHDTQTSKILSNELAEIRKVSQILSNGRISLEQVQLRLTTIHDLGDAMIAIGPAMKTMDGLKTSLSRFMPEADSELNSMTQTLNGLMMDSLAGETFGAGSDFSNEKTDEILQEAASVAEQQIGDKFPSVPTPTGKAPQPSTYE